MACMNMYCTCCFLNDAFMVEYTGSKALVKGNYCINQQTWWWCQKQMFVLFPDVIVHLSTGAWNLVRNACQMAQINYPKRLDRISPLRIVDLGHLTCIFVRISPLRIVDLGHLTCVSDRISSSCDLSMSLWALMGHFTTSWAKSFKHFEKKCILPQINYPKRLDRISPLRIVDLGHLTCIFVRILG